MAVREVGSKAEGNAGPAGNQRHAFAGGTKGDQVGVADCVSDEDALADAAGAGHGLLDGGGARGDGCRLDQADGQAGLALQDAHKVGVAHRGQGVVAHRAVG